MRRNPKETHVFDDFTIFEHDDMVEGYLDGSNLNGMADIIFYNDERGKRCGGSSCLPTNFKKTTNLINLYKEALNIVTKQKGNT